MLLTALAVSSPIVAADMFPDSKPSSGREASRSLTDSGQALHGCLTTELRQAEVGAADVRPMSSNRRGAARWLNRHPASAPTGATQVISGVELRISRPVSIRLDALPADDRDARLQAIASGVAEPRRTLSDYGFPTIDVDVLVADLGPTASGYTTRVRNRPVPTIVVSIETPRADLYRATAHQYAHAVVQSLSEDFSPTWGEAFAVWTTMRALRLERAGEYAALDERLQDMHKSLTSNDSTHAVGNAAWLTFLESRWGVAAVRTTVEELARGGDTAAALERGVRRVSPSRLRQAYADFQLWSLFTGERDDSRHLRGASRLATPRFTSTASGLPALSIRRDPGIEPWGGSRILLFEGGGETGGLQIGFEGDFSARWESDLVLTSQAGAIHRVPLTLRDGRVETTVPLDGLAEAVLLVRRIDADDPTPRGYSYSAHREKGYPFELAETSVESIDELGLLVQWETTHEHRLIGFNVLRTRASGGPRVQVNPVWIPALGAAGRGVGYRFLDTEAEPGVRYEYTIQAVTELGLTSHSGGLSGTRN
ncbi:MAG: hypothetical protein GTN89_08955 [Acidobacteria bacterium]|nr:hypothetical protein [Acidobacteriota bacterium]NIQ30483.1 hypothetical protein [Acidobacteriota bacterium]